MSDDIATFDEQLAVERYPDGPSGRLAALHRAKRPSLDCPYLCDLARRHDDDLVAGGKMTGFNTPGHNATIVEFVNRLHRHP